MSSVAGGMGHPGAALYAITKASVDCAIRQLALEYASKGIRVLSIAPGIIDTPAINNVAHAMERYGDVSDVAKVIAFLCSERASFMTDRRYNAAKLAG
eukprot:scaffold47173_cov51-Attheya_sp.AAC.2